jgi:hypothetical protein
MVRYEVRFLKLFVRPLPRGRALAGPRLCPSTYEYMMVQQANALKNVDGLSVRRKDRPVVKLRFQCDFYIVGSSNMPSSD